MVPLWQSVLSGLLIGSEGKINGSVGVCLKIKGDKFMQSVSYTDIRHSVLDSFYSNLVSKPETDLTYDKALDYVTYSFEVGFSDVEMFVIDFVVYVLCSDFKVSEELSLILERKLLTIIKSKDFDCLIFQIKQGEDDRTDLLADMCIKGLISQEKMNSLLEK